MAISKINGITASAISKVSGVTKSAVSKVNGETLSSLDAFVVSMLHFNGADTSTTFTDAIGHTWTASGNAQIDTAQSVFGGASGLFDGTGDYISAPDHINWQLDGGSNSNAWTIDLRVRFNGDPLATVVDFVGQHQDANNYWAFLYNSNTLQLLVNSGGSTIINVSRTWNPASATWYHLALVKDGTTGYTFYADGTNLGAALTDTSTLPDYTGSLYVGGNAVSNVWYLAGWIDELRISKGIARWTADFTPPSAEY